MPWYKEYKNEWKEIIETVAREMGRTEQMVEKDTIQSFFLYELSRADLPYVFKGGTSLSKAYGLIDRFSEDIDLSMSRKVTEAEKRRTKTLILDIANGLGLSCTNPENVKSRHDYNKYIFEYESMFAIHPLEIIIETSFYQSVYPAEKCEIGSIVYTFCKERGIDFPIPFEAAVVSMNVQTIERTFIDKVFAVCDYRIQNMQDRDSRHLYDIAKLLQEVEVNEELKKLVRDVRTDRMMSKNNPSAQPENNLPEMLREIIESRFYESDYNSITQKLLYEQMSYDEAIQKGIAIVAELELF